ncbi:hypothetical protein [Desulfoluna spongiiphila]|uniref:Uncharacterized protein n=1 Tax=Desulfoluna spongiiphila TaxID=419481 RepID=A0A1G5B046_9BACT|nr:hypothetical protein [Desulfoluna spongiiphila]SCX83519.1 hypothetical protein SAMN05216233_101551 [Desulfoluna spongiiphila]VVS92110.1 hypothetical protein DBB_16780 [Desulfoluna spongiiphila]
MNRWFLFGSISMMAGLFLLVMKALAGLMPGDPNRFDYSLKSLLAPERLAWIDGLSSSGVQSAAQWMQGAPLYIYCFGLGLLFILASGLAKE